MTTETETEKPVETPPAKGVWSGPEAFTINVSMAIARPTPIWVVKLKDGRYLRASTTTTMMSVKDRRLATRFDSPTWAATLAAWTPGAKVKRLMTKTEREAESVSGKAWTYRAPTAAGSTDEPKTNAPPIVARVDAPSSGAAGESK